MIRSLCLRQAQSISLRRPIGLRPVSPLTKCAPMPVSSFELSSLLVRRASSKPPPKSTYTPRTSVKSATTASEPKKASETTRTLIYHAGVPRIWFLSALKLTTGFIFGFFAVVSIPRFMEINPPWWQTAGLAVASVTPLLLFWYLTSPMVMWVHLKIPKAVGTTPKEVLKYASTNPSKAEINIHTMAPLGWARVTKTTLGELRPVKRRFGLVNYVRDTTRENAERKWYHFRAVGQFMVWDDMIADARSHEKWLWYAIRAAMDERKANNVAKTPEAIAAQSRAALKMPATEKTRLQTKPLNVLKAQAGVGEAGKLKANKKT